MSLFFPYLSAQIKILFAIVGRAISWRKKSLQLKLTHLEFHITFSFLKIQKVTPHQVVCCLNCNSHAYLCTREWSFVSNYPLLVCKKMQKQSDSYMC